MQPQFNLPNHRPPTHPGEFLRELFLEPVGMTQAELAEHLGWTKAKVNELIKGKRGVTPEVALSLADALGTSAAMWMNLQQAYDLWHALQHHQARPRHQKFHEAS